MKCVCVCVCEFLTCPLSFGPNSRQECALSHCPRNAGLTCRSMWLALRSQMLLKLLQSGVTSWVSYCSSMFLLFLNNFIFAILFPNFDDFYPAQPRRETSRRKIVCPAILSLWWNAAGSATRRKPRRPRRCSCPGTRRLILYVMNRKCVWYVQFIRYDSVWYVSDLFKKVDQRYSRWYCSISYQR